MTDAMIKTGRAAKAAAAIIGISGSDVRNHALAEIANQLQARTAEILSANAQDVAAAQSAGMRDTLLDRLTLTPARIDAMAEGARTVMRLEDPIGIISGGITRPNGMRVVKTKVPLGVIGMIYEARPNVTTDAAVLCLKAGNACLLRGGKEAFLSNQKIVEIIRDAISHASLPADCVQLVHDTTRESATEMMKMNGLIDVLIPRGGAGLIRSVIENATVPVIETGIGNCHVYVDETADIEMAARIIENAKASRPSVCNAAETLLVHEGIAERFLPRAAELLAARHVTLRGCERTRAILGTDIVTATEADYATEFLDYILAVRVVPSLEEAIAHIQKYTTHHSEAIVTASYPAAERFTREIDAAAVYVNASTRFTDGGEFGEGAEIGISTQKLHARGPMGIRQLTTDKYIIYGSGQTRW